MQRLSWEAVSPLYEALGIEFTEPQLAATKAQDRFPVLGGGERGGKSFATAAILLPHVVLLPRIRKDRFFNEEGKLVFNAKVDKPRNPDFLFFGPTYAEPRIEFQYLQNWLEDLDLLLTDGVNRPSKPQDGPWRMVTKHGVVIATWSMEDPRSIRSVDLEGGAICEAGRCPWDGIERVQGRVSAKKGFVIYSGTMENSQQWYQDWMLMGQRQNHLGIVSYSLPTWSNRHEFPGGRNDPEILRLEKFYTEDIFAMRVAAEPRPPRHRVLKEVTSAHVKRRRIPEHADIEVWIDPGYASAYAVLWAAVWDEFRAEKDEKTGQVQNVLLGKRFHIFDEFYEQGRTTDDVISLCKRHRRWGAVRHGVIDVAAKGHRDAGESALEKWKKQTRLIWNFKYWREDPLIERIRTSAKADQFTIDPKCVGLIAECGLGEPVFPEMTPWKYLTDRDGRILSEKPLDKWNHSAKALGYGLLHHLGQVETKTRPTSVSRLQRNTPVRSLFAPARK